MTTTDLVTQLLQITEELSRAAVKQASDLKPGEIGEILARFEELKTEINPERNPPDAAA